MMTMNVTLPYARSDGSWHPTSRPPEPGEIRPIVLYETGETVERGFDPVTDITWDDLSGQTRGYTKSPPFYTSQPTYGCTTGGDRVYARLMEHLCPTGC